MKFSIIIVTYNRKKELAACLESICSQKIQTPFEVVIIFNGESSYFEKIKESYPSFKCYYITTHTPAYARNYGVAKSSGELIFFIDDDCTLPENYFNQLFLFF